MSQSRKFRRQGFRTGKRGDPLPPGWDQTQSSARDQAGEAMKALQKMLPDRGLVLLTIPSGTSSQDVEAMACVHNLEDRSQVASVFEAMLGWWSGDVILAQPDRACVTALREGVAAVADAPAGEILQQIAGATQRLLEPLIKRQPVVADQIINDALMLAVSALTIYGRFIRPEQHVVPGGSADASGAPQPAPMPPPQKWPKGNTKETLVTDLLERPPCEARDQIIEMARAGKFHDYDSEVAAPKAVLVDILARFGYPDLAGKARDGGYDDEHPTIEQLEELRRDVGPQAFDAMSAVLGQDPSKRGRA